MSVRMERRRSGWARGSCAGLLLALALAIPGAQRAGAEPAWRGDPDRSNKGEVQFVLTPRDVKDGRFRVDVEVNTHGGDLAELNLQAATELRAEGKTLRPLEPVPLRGHHGKGRLEFQLDRLPDSFEIVIRGVRAMGDLTFRWP